MKAKNTKKISDRIWEEMDEKETSAIQFNLGDGVIHNILEIHTTKQILNKLEGL